MIPKEKIIRVFTETDMMAYAKEHNFVGVALENLRYLFKRLSELENSKLYLLHMECSCGNVDDTFVVFKGDEFPQFLKDAIKEGRYPKAICSACNELAQQCMSMGIDPVLLVPGLRKAEDNMFPFPGG